MKLINKTSQTQHVNLLDGSCHIVDPGKSVIVAESNLYAEEKERLKKFFNFGDQKIEAPKKEKKEDKKNIFGGDE